MDILNSKLYRSIEILISFLLLNLMWILLSLLVVTAFPATAAMFGVVREWSRGTDSGALEPFFRHLKANFVQSFCLGLIWIVLGARCGSISSCWEGAETWVKCLIPVDGLGGLCLHFHLDISVSCHGQLCERLEAVLKNSFLISLSQLGITLLCVVVCVAMLFIVLTIPVTRLLAGSVTAYAVYTLCKRAFSRIEAAKQRDI